jgi:hypothetical protein
MRKKMLIPFLPALPLPPYATPLALANIMFGTLSWKYTPRLPSAGTGGACEGFEVDKDK